MANANGSVTGITRRDKCLKKTYECVNYKKYGKSRCVYHNIKEEWLIDNVKNLDFEITKPCNLFLSGIGFVHLVSLDAKVTIRIFKMIDVEIRNDD